ncbi:CHAT domain-containing protein [uncultured Psychroserpens sp.]|uniref:CHAT domain-containing protein n=1 Tax=uncultured Psychroserpens sp. TaxID=255436 RepID=UPI002620C63B|nr:CHAT domain-containing tetratricopeptide repeat protein [uncultured Psychroserpens sp.]
MKQWRNCLKMTILFGAFLSVFSSYSQSTIWDGAQTIDSLISVKAFKKADTLLLTNINDLRHKKSYLELTKRIYYFGKIALNLNPKDVAIKKVNDFANSITDATDSLAVSRQKHLVLARFYVFLRDYQNAANQNLLALEETKKMPDATGDLFGLIHHNLSIDNRRQGNIKKATWHSRKSLDYYLSYPKSDKSKVLDAYNSLGARMWDVFKIDSALFYFKKGEKIIDELEPTAMNKFYHRAKSQSNISSVSSLLGNSIEAMLYNEKAIKNYSNFIKSDADGKDFFKEEARLFLFLTIENYADDFSKQANYTKARDLIQYVYDQKLKFLSPDDSEIAYSALQLGNIYLKLKQHKLAEELFNKGLEIYTKSEQKNYLGIADAYYYKGVINEYYNKVDLAKTYYEKSKTYYETIFGENYDKFYLDAMVNYSNFYSNNGYAEKAIEMATNAYDYVVKNQGQTTALESSQLLNLASIHFNSKNYNKAFNYINKTLKLLNTSSNEQINEFSIEKPKALLLKSKIEVELHNSKDSLFLKDQYVNIKKAISILEKQKTVITEDQNLSIILYNNDEIFEFSKQLALRLYNQTKNPIYLKELLSLHESKLYNKIRQQLNVKQSFTTKDIPESVLAKEQQLKADLNSILKNQNNIEFFIETNKTWQNFLETLQKDYPKYYNLKYASVAKSLDYFDTHFPENSSIIRYVFIDKNLYAFVIEKKKIEVHNIDVTALNKLLFDHKNNQPILENNLETNHNLYKVLWKPFENTITNKDIIIIPDRDLFNLSFDVLTPKHVANFKALHTESLLSKYNLSYNYSLLLINKNKTPSFFENNFVAFTPEFNDQMKTKYKTAITDSVFLDKTYLTLLPQPFAVDLAEEYSKLFDGTSFLNEDASKQIFTEQAKEHKIIHIGTHAESNNVSPELSRLIFAKSAAKEDNSLYTYEIYNQNLSSNLAILTACETGKPTYQSGEGMISLAHAFNYAGSESILTSLWKIDEKSSSEILKLFYNNLANGLKKDEALRRAKLDYIASAEGRTAAPEYWAGLILIGDSNPIEIQTSSNIIFWLTIAFVFLILMIVVAKKKSVF